MSPAYQIDERYDPILRVIWQRQPSDDEFAAYLSEMITIMRRVDATRRIMVADASSGALVTAAQRRMQSDWLLANRALITQRTIAIVFIYDSALLRGMLTAILWFSPLPAPHVVCATREAALEACETILREQGFPMPRGIEEAWLGDTQLRRANRS